MSAPVYEINGRLTPEMKDNFSGDNGAILVEQEEDDVYLVAQPKGGDD